MEINKGFHGGLNFLNLRGVNHQPAQDQSLCRRDFYFKDRRATVRAAGPGRDDYRLWPHSICLGDLSKLSRTGNRLGVQAIAM
jgi:hypothetical protein